MSPGPFPTRTRDPLRNCPDCDSVNIRNVMGTLLDQPELGHPARAFFDNSHHRLCQDCRALFEAETGRVRDRALPPWLGFAAVLLIGTVAIGFTIWFLTKP